ncbi:MAG: sensor histidine kinase [Gemmatimonadaceae bacterium]
MTAPERSPEMAATNGDGRPAATARTAPAARTVVPAEESRSPQPNPLRRGRVWALSVTLWTVWGFWSAKQTSLFMAASGRDPAEFAVLLRASLASAWVWALCTPLILWLAQRYRIERGTLLRRVPLYLAASLTVLLLDVAASYLVRVHLNNATGVSPLGLLLYYLDYSVAFFFVIVAIKHALDYYGWYRERQVQAAHLEHQLTKAQLQVLKMQLQPHFLFNTLNAISELVHEDADTADRMITRLGDLLRSSLDLAGRQEVPLKQELEFLRAYLEIEQTRFRDRLEVRMHIDPEALDARVPNLILQPLVENAIKHGTAPRAAAGLIEIFAARRDGQIVVEVRDNGGGLAANVGSFREGVGLRNTRARLKQLYGSGHRFELRNRTGGGAIVTMVIPYRLGSEHTGEFTGEFQVATVEGAQVAPGAHGTQRAHT